VSDDLTLAKKVLMEDSEVLYGIFGLISSSGYFPPMAFLNEFLLAGHDPCDQDGRMAHWQPFALSLEDYQRLKEWWILGHPGSVENALGETNWNDWAVAIVENGE